LLNFEVIFHVLLLLVVAVDETTLDPRPIDVKDGNDDGGGIGAPASNSLKEGNRVVAGDGT
jgi:hypothetical protein